MTIQIGDRIPSATLTRATDDGPKPITTDELFGGKTVALFAVPGAFTPTCSARHLPGFKDHRGDLSAKGVDTIACMSVNDAFVMGAWADSQGIGKDDIVMLGDGNGDFTRADRPVHGRQGLRHGRAVATLFDDRQGRRRRRS